MYVETMSNIETCQSLIHFDSDNEWKPPARRVK